MHHINYQLSLEFIAILGSILTGILSFVYYKSTQKSFAWLIALGYWAFSASELLYIFYYHDSMALADNFVQAAYIVFCIFSGVWLYRINALKKDLFLNSILASVVFLFLSKLCLLTHLFVGLHSYLFVAQFLKLCACVLPLVSFAFAYVQSFEKEKKVKSQLENTLNNIAAGLSQIDNLYSDLITGTKAMSKDSQNANQIIGDSFGDSEQTESVILSLYQSNNEVKNLLEVINDIGMQTKILALNANIEAEKAGQAGRGFFVVASEISNLAKQSKSSLALIESTLNEIQMKLGEALGSITKTTRSMKSASRISEQITKSIHDQNSLSSSLYQHIDLLDENLSSLRQSISKN